MNKPGRNLILALVLVAECIFFTLMADGWTSPRNYSNILIELAITATLAMGMLLVILPGQIDLAAGSGAGLMGGLATVACYRLDWPAPAAMAAGLAAGALVWGAMGFLIVRQRIPAFIVTLGGMLVFRGLFWTTIENSTVPVKVGGQDNLLSRLTTATLTVPQGMALAALLFAVFVFLQWRGRARLQSLGLPAGSTKGAAGRIVLTGWLLFSVIGLTSGHRGLPMAALVFGAVALAVHVVVAHTRLGRHLVAIGGNEEAARLSGIPVERAVVMAFALMGLIVAVTGFLQTSYVGSSSPSIGELMELDAIAACVIGGVSLRGGRGTVAGVLFGSLIMTVLLKGMSLMSVQPELRLIVRGLVLVAAVWLDVAWNRRTGRAA
jgi:D-xylose transport system permease protein